MWGHTWRCKITKDSVKTMNLKSVMLNILTCVLCWVYLCLKIYSLPVTFGYFFGSLWKKGDNDSQTLSMFLKDSVNVINCLHFHICMTLHFLLAVSILVSTTKILFFLPSKIFHWSWIEHHKINWRSSWEKNLQVQWSRQISHAGTAFSNYANICPVHNNIKHNYR